MAEEKISDLVKATLRELAQPQRDLILEELNRCWEGRREAVLWVPKLEPEPSTPIYSRWYDWRIIAGLLPHPDEPIIVEKKDG